MARQATSDGRRRESDRDRGADEGLTLVELLMAMSILPLLLAVVSAVLVSTGRMAARTQNTSVTTTELRRVFDAMDKQVHYADAVNYPGLANNAYWVEFRTTPPTAVTPSCIQWRYDIATGKLQQRTWSATAAPTAAATWTTLLQSSVPSATPANPFVLLPTTSTRVMEELQFVFTDNRKSGSTNLTTTLVALNSTSSSLGNIDANSDGVSDSPVCLGGTTLAAVRS